MRCVIIICILALSGCRKPTSRTAYIGGVNLTITNVISAEQHEPACVLIRHIKDGKTNEFHAWSVPVHLEP